jgi:hypothetical protein
MKRPGSLDRADVEDTEGNCAGAEGGLTLSGPSRFFWQPGWKRHKYGGSCPECHASAHAPATQRAHMRWHNQQRELFAKVEDDYTILYGRLAEQETEITELRAQMDYLAKLLGRPLIEKLAELKEGK